MADPKDNESFFRKVVRFVANPATDWHDLNTRQDDGARGRTREVRAEGDDRAQAAQRLRAQARIRHAAPRAPRRPDAGAAGRAGRLVAPRRLRSAHAPTARAPARAAASRPRSTRSSSRWSARADVSRPATGVAQRATALSALRPSPPQRCAASPASAAAAAAAASMPRRSLDERRGSPAGTAAAARAADERRQAARRPGGRARRPPAIDGHRPVAAGPTDRCARAAPATVTAATAPGGRGQRGRCTTPSSTRP